MTGLSQSKAEFENGHRTGNRVQATTVGSAAPFRFTTMRELAHMTLALHHRLNGVGQHQRTQAPWQHIPERCRQLGVHKGLATGEADQRSRKIAGFDLIEIFAYLGSG